MTSSTGTSKYVSVRITTAQYKQLQEMGEPFGSSVNSLTQRAVSNFLEDEGPIWRSKGKELRRPKK